jgi:hypothetical protein
LLERRNDRASGIRHLPELALRADGRKREIEVRVGAGCARIERDALRSRGRARSPGQQSHEAQQKKQCQVPTVISGT